MKYGYGIQASMNLFGHAKSYGGIFDQFQWIVAVLVAIVGTTYLRSPVLRAL